MENKLDKNSLPNNLLLTGTFDLLHSGHFNLLFRANEMGSVFVIVRPDQDILEKKGVLPFQNEKTRLINISKLLFVKEAKICSYSIDDTIKLIKKWNITSIVVGEDNRNNPLINDLVLQGEINKIVLDRTDDISST